MGGNSYYGGEGGGEPAYRSTVSLVSEDCCLPVSAPALTVCCLWEQAQDVALEVSFRLCSLCLLPMGAGPAPCLMSVRLCSTVCCLWEPAEDLALEASCLQLGSQPICTLLFVSCPSSAALMPADGTVENSIVKQSANGGNIDVDNGDATCSAPVPAFQSVFCLVHVGAIVVLPLLSYQACCCLC